jgi:hypothetical protein
VRGARRTLHRAGACAAAVVGVGAVYGAPALAATPTVTVVGDSVLVTGHSFGRTTVQATRPDAVTGKPVVIGQYEDFASAFTPFSVNTTAPTPLKLNGDCWQIDCDRWVCLAAALPAALALHCRLSQ